MDVVELLKEQHRQLKGLFQQVRDEQDRRQRKVLVGNIGRALRVHIRLEEKVVYPAAAKAFQNQSAEEELVLVSYEEHRAAERALEVFEATTPSDRRFVARARVLEELIVRHIDEEEEELLPGLEAKLTAEGLVKLGEVVERRLPALTREVAPDRSASRAKPSRGAASGTPRTRAVRGAQGATRGRAAPGRAGRGAGEKGGRRAGGGAGAKRAGARRGESPGRS